MFGGSPHLGEDDLVSDWVHQRLTLAEAGHRISCLRPQGRIVGELLPPATHGQQDSTGQGSQCGDAESPIHSTTLAGSA
jgi:hypothetical protein